MDIEGTLVCSDVCLPAAHHLFPKTNDFLHQCARTLLSRKGADTAFLITLLEIFFVREQDGEQNLPDISTITLDAVRERLAQAPSVRLVCDLKEGDERIWGCVVADQICINAEVALALESTTVRIV